MIGTSANTAALRRGARTLAENRSRSARDNEFDDRFGRSGRGRASSCSRTYGNPFSAGGIFLTADDPSSDRIQEATAPPMLSMSMPGNPSACNPNCSSDYRQFLANHDHSIHLPAGSWLIFEFCNISSRRSVTATLRFACHRGRSRGQPSVDVLMIKRDIVFLVAARRAADRLTVASSFCRACDN